MKCPCCEAESMSLVKATRSQAGELARRRECQACGNLFITREIYDPDYKIANDEAGPRPRLVRRRKDNNDIFSAWNKHNEGPQL